MECIIIDDEPLAHKVILNYCNNLSFLKIIKTCHSALHGLDFLNKNTVDLIFLDINMPTLKGLDFLKTLQNPPLVIVTTAYKEFAIEGYELDVIDYLLKPFSFERFLKAINKAQTQLKLIKNTKKEAVVNNISISQPDQRQATNNRIFIKSEKKTHQVLLADILYLESFGSYVKVHLEKDLIITLERLTNFENLLPKHEFIRIHRSYIIAIRKIKTIEGNQVKISDVKIPVGNVYKHNLKGFIN